MRTVKFRAWDKKEKIMLESFIHEWWLKFAFAPEEPETVCTDFDNPNLAIMQSTWILDDTEKEIYEWDIVYYETDSRDPRANPYQRAQIEWNGGKWIMGNYVLGDYDNIGDLQIIGNICQNADFLKN